MAAAAFDIAACIAVAVAISVRVAAAAVEIVANISVAIANVAVAAAIAVAVAAAAIVAAVVAAGVTVQIRYEHGLYSDLFFHIRSLLPAFLVWLLHVLHFTSLHYTFAVVWRFFRNCFCIFFWFRFFWLICIQLPIAMAIAIPIPIRISIFATLILLSVFVSAAVIMAQKDCPEILFWVWLIIIRFYTLFAPIYWGIHKFGCNWAMQNKGIFL